MQITKPLALNEVGGRENNEDAIFPQGNEANATNRFFLVCDGMGGHECGEIASNSVCESFALSLKNICPDDFDESAFEHVLNLAFDRLDEKDNNSETAKKMGTTLAFLYLNNKQAFMAHIGDSRIYHLRKTDNNEVRILYQSSDHSYINELVKAEVITEAEAANHPKKNVITRAIYPHLQKRCKADIHITTDVMAGDRFFLCSDGITESVTNEHLCAIASEYSDDEVMMNAILTQCEKYSRDNFSAWLISIVEGVQRRD